LAHEKIVNERELILGRVKEALRVPTAAQPTVAHSGFEAWLPPVATGFDGRLELFRTNSVALRTDFRLCENETAMSEELRAIRDAEGWKKIATHKGGLAEAASASLQLPVLSTDGGYDVHELESCDAGLTDCDALIAQTGSLLVSSRSAGGRALSVLPPHHVAIARRAQLLPDLPTAFALIKTRYAAQYPSFITLITGPSRTGDIERILVLGAHGPRKLTILCF
jgi:L-lactate dehydrogenase complex protein LldG